MGHEFPLEVNWNSTSVEIVSTHVLSLLLMLGAIFCAIRSKRWPPKRSNIWIWALAMLGAPIAISMIAARLDPDARRAAAPFFTVCNLAFWVSGFAGMWAVHRNLKTNKKASSFGCVFVSLLLVTIGFFTVIIPASVYPIEAARRSQCKHNLKQIGIALHNFHDIRGHFPESAAGEPLVIWRVHALPYLDNVDLFDTYDQTLAWNSDKNDAIAKQRIGELSCPSAETMHDDRDRWFTHYAMVTGEGTMGGNRSQRSFDEFSDGVSNTLAVVEAAGLNIVWTEPRDSQVTEENPGINLTGRTAHDSPALISAWHRGGGHAAFADGSVRFLRHNIDPTVLKTLTTVGAGDSVEDWDRR